MGIGIGIDYGIDFAITIGIAIAIGIGIDFGIAIGFKMCICIGLYSILGLEFVLVLVFVCGKGNVLLDHLRLVASLRALLERGCELRLQPIQPVHLRGLLEHWQVLVVEGHSDCVRGQVDVFVEQIGYVWKPQEVGSAD